MREKDQCRGGDDEEIERETEVREHEQTEQRWVCISETLSFPYSPQALCHAKKVSK